MKHSSQLLLLTIVLFLSPFCIQESYACIANDIENDRNYSSFADTLFFRSVGTTIRLPIHKSPSRHQNSLVVVQKPDYLECVNQSDASLSYLISNDSGTEINGEIYVLGGVTSYIPISELTPGHYYIHICINGRCFESEFELHDICP